MDKSKQYILMCEKAWKDILKPSYKATTGRYMRGKFKDIDIQIDEYGQYWYRLEFDDKVPIYTQDQLQEMAHKILREKLPSKRIMGATLAERNFEANWVLDCLGNFLKKSGFGSNSTEQLWLAFIMNEKYNKIWTGKDWGAK